MFFIIFLSFVFISIPCWLFLSFLFFEFSFSGLTAFFFLSSSIFSISKVLSNKKSAKASTGSSGLSVAICKIPKESKGSTFSLKYLLKTSLFFSSNLYILSFSISSFVLTSFSSSLFSFVVFSSEFNFFIICSPFLILFIFNFKSS